jgi:CheY-like chemotaxis protein
MASILVVDDSVLIRNKMSSILHNLGFTTAQAVNGQDGLEKVETGTFDCIFTDLLMPVMDGLDFLQEVKRRWPAMPVIVVSADIQKPTRDRCLELGAADVLPKPPKPEDVRELLSTLLQSE